MTNNAIRTEVRASQSGRMIPDLNEWPIIDGQTYARRYRVGQVCIASDWCGDDTYACWVEVDGRRPSVFIEADSADAARESLARIIEAMASTESDSSTVQNMAASAAALRSDPCAFVAYAASSARFITELDMK